LILRYPEDIEFKDLQTCLWPAAEWVNVVTGNKDLTSTRSFEIPGSREEWPASGTMWNVASGNTLKETIRKQDIGIKYVD
jgi:hypothetical protein